MSSFFARNLKRRYPTVAQAQGSWLTDTEGKRYLDGCSGAVAANLGHGLPQINEAIRWQLDRVAFAHTSQFLSEPALKLSEQLLSLAPENFRGGRVFFCCGGSEAVESALKMARGYALELNGESKRSVVISRWNSYHGASFGALSATGHPARRRPYLPMLKDQPHIAAAYPYRCPCRCVGVCASAQCALSAADELEQAILSYGGEHVLAFIGEPVVGAALGAVAPAAGYWKRIREICTKYGVLLIADEVMTGLGRCGANFAIDLFDVQPDLIVAGKGLAAGYMPLAAVLASARIGSAFENGSGVFEHGFTYSGHPLSCAAGAAAVDYLVDNKIVQRVADSAREFRLRLESLRQFAFVGDVRSTGFLAGIELVANQRTKEPFPAALSFSRRIADAALKEGLLVYPGAGFVDGAGDHIMVAPPLNIEAQDMDALFSKLTAAFAGVKEKVYGDSQDTTRQECADDGALLRARSPN